MDDDSWRISGYKALHYILQDSFCEFLGFLMGIFLSLFLYQQHQQLSVTIIQVVGKVQPRESFFTHKLYMIATGMVPAMINLYITHRNKSIDMATTTPLSCLDQSSVVLRDSIMWERHGGNTVRGFPGTYFVTAQNFESYAVSKMCGIYLELLQLGIVLKARQSLWKRLH